MQSVLPHCPGETLACPGPAPRMLAENIATFIARAAERAAPHAFRQGARKPPLALPRGPSLDLLATTRVRKVSALALEGLAHLARGFPAFVSHEVLTAAD